MEGEAAKSTWLAVIMVVTVMLAVAVASTMVIGRRIMNSSVDTVADYMGIRSGGLKVLEDTITKMSAASAQLIISENSDYIDWEESKLKNYLYGKTSRTDLSKINETTTGDVYLEVRRSDSNGLFVVTIHRYNCNVGNLGATGANGTCNCAPQH